MSNLRSNKGNKENTEAPVVKTLSAEESKDYFNKVLTQLNLMEDQMKKMRQENKQLREEGARRDKEVKELTKRVNLLEQRSRINNIEIANFPPTPKENLRDVVKSIAKAVGVEILDDDIQAVHRVQRYDQTARKNIVAQFCSRWKKNSILQACKSYRKQNESKISAKSVNPNLPDDQIYVSEHLTPGNKMLLGKTKKQAKAVQWKFIWTKDGVIHAKKDENDTNSTQITCEEDLLKME